MFAELLDPETGVIRLRQIFPVCPLCNRQRDYPERRFILIFGHCHKCEDMRKRVLTTGGEDMETWLVTDWFQGPEGWRGPDKAFIALDMETGDVWAVFESPPFGSGTFRNLMGFERHYWLPDFATEEWVGGILTDPVFLSLTSRVMAGATIMRAGNGIRAYLDSEAKRAEGEILFYLSDKIRAMVLTNLVLGSKGGNP